LGQIEVYEFLKNERLCGNDCFYTCSKIQKVLREQGLSSGLVQGVRGDLLRLEFTGYLDAKIDANGWLRTWRLKLKYAKKV
jgi:hypothetical protein